MNQLNRFRAFLTALPRMPIRTQIILFLLILTLFGVIAGCRQQAVSPQQQAQTPITDVTRYFPTEPNLTWVYAGEGNEFADFTRRVLFRQGNLVQMSETNGGTQLGMIFQAMPEAVTLTHSREEWYSNNSLFQEAANQNQIILKAPLEVGASWKNSTDQREVVAVGETVEVPAGSYVNTIKIKVTSAQSQSGSYWFEYYAPDTGLIFREFFADNSRISSKLKNFAKSAAPDYKEGFLIMKGTPQSLQLNLVRGEPYPFYTYSPSDMVTQRISADDGTSFRFLGQSGGVQREDVYVTLFFCQPGVTPEQAAQTIDTLLSQSGWRTRDRKNQPKQFNWSIREWTFEHRLNSKRYSGQVYLAQHQGQTFYIMTHLPPESSSNAAYKARADVIIDELIWTDDNTRLNQK
ncbi:hypothetical protein [Acetonema longum]|uniref:Uncharacterized protein n=1 Tax=Acetonema longum DSM 6540 TaxID=1009370 RepID=F7NHS5_9FIRM|nr:hypothetical protein [Acetonema longum]EGO64450.1 hypothetical protein ALO_08113 [Acetonema longum DSM 6540]